MQFWWPHHAPQKEHGRSCWSKVPVGGCDSLLAGPHWQGQGKEGAGTWPQRYMLPRAAGQGQWSRPGGHARGSEDEPALGSNNAICFVHCFPSGSPEFLVKLYFKLPLVSAVLRAMKGCDYPALGWSRKAESLGPLGARAERSPWRAVLRPSSSQVFWDGICGTVTVGSEPVKTGVCSWAPLSKRLLASSQRKLENGLRLANICPSSWWRFILYL